MESPVKAKPRLAIIGSCVTRDPLNGIIQDIDIAAYQARTSIVSMMTPPCKVELLPISQDMSAFERRCAEADLAKTWRNVLATPCDIVLIDFIDERFGLARYDSSYFTYSTAVRKSLATETKNFIAPGSPVYLELMAQYLGAFCEEIASVPRLHINAVYWTDQKEDESKFDSATQAQADKANRVLDIVYNAISKRTPATFIRTQRDLLVAAAQHRWGNAPFHYSLPTERLIAENLVLAARQSMAAKAGT